MTNADALSSAVVRITHDISEYVDDELVTVFADDIRAVLSALPASPEAVTAAEKTMRKWVEQPIDTPPSSASARTVLAAFAEARALLREARGEVWSLGDDEDIDQIIEAYECKRYSGTFESKRLYDLQRLRLRKRIAEALEGSE